VANELLRRLLIVEDAEEIRSTMADLFGAEGYDVALAADGRQALEWLCAAKGDELPKLILLDLMMPNMDGYQFLAERQKNAVISSIPVLLMSAGGEAEAKATHLGTKGYLKKPFKDIDSILETVARFF
jgi:CheY-like chemotaxis protein